MHNRKSPLIIFKDFHLNRFGSAAIVFLGCISSIFAGILVPVSTNNVKITAENIYQITGPDAYFVFAKPANEDWQSQYSLTFQYTPTEQADPILARTIDLFWASSEHGFDEIHKVRYRIPEQSNTPGIYGFNLGDLATNGHFQLEDLTLLRFDSNLQQDSQLQFSMDSDDGGSCEPLPFDPETSVRFYHGNPPIEVFNDLGKAGNGLRVIGGDPFIIFPFTESASGRIPERMLIDLQVRQHPQNYTYCEIFWTTPSHGFSERYKAFFMYSLGQANHGIHESKPVSVNLGEFIQTIEPNAESVTSIRLDLDKNIATPLSLSVAFGSDAPANTTNMNLRYSINAKYLNGTKTIHYAIHHAIKDFLARFSSDPFFAIPYLLTIMGLFSANFIISKSRLMKKSKSN